MDFNDSFILVDIIRMPYFRRPYPSCKRYNIQLLKKFYFVRRKTMTCEEFERDLGFVAKQSMPKISCISNKTR